MGAFSHPPPSDCTALCEAVPSSCSADELKLHPFICLGSSCDLAVAGPDIQASHEGFVPAPIDTGGLSLPGSLHGIKETLAHQLHEVWAKNKIEAGFTFAEVTVLVCHSRFYQHIHYTIQLVNISTTTICVSNDITDTVFP